jgi:hypothetical protein
MGSSNTDARFKGALQKPLSSAKAFVPAHRVAIRNGKGKLFMIV